MTMKKLAELANVSKSTVSKAFSGSPDISKQTRDYIFEIAKEYGCYDKYNKRPFDKKIIAIICPEINSEDYYSIINLLINLLDTRSATMLLSTSSFNENKEKDIYKYFSTYGKADGIIIVNTLGVYSKEEVIVPTVSMFARHNSAAIDNVDFSTTEAMRNIMSTLKEFGHKQIGFAGESFTTNSQSLFKQMAREFAISLNDTSIKVSNKRFEEAGRDVVRQWIAEGTLPTAIVAAYDYIAIGIMKELSQNNLQIPKDVSVVGINDITISSFIEPTLSSVKYPNEELCQEAVSLLFKKIDNRYYRARHITEIPAQFISRDSIGPVKKDF